MVDQKSPEDIQEQVVQFRKWLDQQPDTPKTIDDKFCLRFLHSCYYDFEKAKTAVELFFSIRTSAPDLLTNRDPMSAPIQKTLNIVNLAQYRIKGNKNIWIWQLNDPGLEQYDYLLDAKVFFMSTDSWLLENDFLEEEDDVILDVKDISLKFLTKFNVSIAKKLTKYQQDAMPIRLRQVHIVNTPSAIDKIFALIKPFLKQEMTNMMHFHTPKSSTLLKYFDKEDLPEDYGGTRGTMSEHNVTAVEKIMQIRDFYLNDTYWRCEHKKGKNKSETPTEVGSFRTLTID